MAAAKRSRPAASAQAAVMQLTSLAQMRVIAHPLRLRLLDAFVPEPRTTMQVARLLGEPPTRLYRHVNALFRAGLLVQRGRRKKRGTTETYYQAAAGRFEAAPDVFEPGHAGGIGVSRTLAQLLREAEQQLVAARSTGAPNDGDLVLTALSVHASPREIARLRRRLAAWIKDCTRAKGAGATWQGVVAFYPARSRR